MLQIKEVIKKKGLTIEEVADMLGMHRVNLSRIINGNPTIETLQKIARVLEVEVKDLFSAGKTSVNGFVEYNDEVYKIQSRSDLEAILEKMKA